MIIPLRFLIPLLSFVVGLALIGFEAYQVDRQLEEREEVNARNDLRSDMTSLQGELNLHFKSGDMRAVQNAVSRLGFEIHTRETALVGGDGTIIAAGRLELAGKSLGVLGATIDRAVLARVRQRMSGEIIHQPGEDVLAAYYPVITDARIGQDRTTFTGVMFVQYNFAGDRAEIRELIIKSTAQGGLFVLVVMAFVWLGLHFVLNRRVDLLVDMTKRFAQGDFNASAGLKGHDELAELSRAYDDMALSISQAQENARRSSSLLAEAQDIAHIGSWRWDIVEGTLAWSDEIYRIFGLRPQEFGATYEAFLESVHPDDRDDVNNAVSNSIESRAPYRIEHRVLWRDGTVRCVEERGGAQYLEDGSPAYMTGTVQDITERKQAENAMWESEARLNAFFDEAPVGLAMLDRDLRFEKVNEVLATITGKPVEDYPGRTVGEVAPEIAGDIEPVYRQVLITGEPIHAREVERQDVNDPNQKNYWTTSVFPLIAADGVTGGLGVVAVDITERKNAETEIRDLNEDLEARVIRRTADLAAANDELHQAMAQLKDAQGQLVESEKMASLGGLVAGVAHEINTPVGIGVTAATHLTEATKNFRRNYDDGAMKRRDLESFLGVAEQSTDIIFGNLRRAADLIKSFKQVAVDQSSDERRVFNACEYIDEIVTSLGAVLKKSPHKVVVNCDPALELDSYPGAYSQILTNLIMNSLVHAYDADDAGTITIDLHADKDGIMLRYADDGKGMPEDAVAKVFEPFFTTKRGAGGSGLGMHILYNLVNGKLSGAVTCESEPGKGTTFTIATPLPGGKKDGRNAA